MIRETFHAKADKQFKTHLSGIPLKTINCATLKKASLRFFFYLCVCACVLKHLAESPQEDKIICTWLLRGALHKDHFSKITAWLAFIPYFWKPSCFLRLPLLPLLLLPSLTIPSPLCHVLVFICWFCSSSFSPCVKNERLKIGWARTGKAGGGGGQERMKGRRQKQRLHIGEITVCSAEAVLFSALTVTIQSQAPSIYIILWKPNVLHRQCKMVPSPSVERLYTNVMDPQHDKRNSIDQPQAAA